MNIFDYCKWRGDIPFSCDEFNHIDALIMSQLCYYPFDSYFENNDQLTIKQLYNLISLKDDQINKTLYKYEYNLLKLLSVSKRFANLKVHNYVSIIDDSNTEQFSAMMIDISTLKTAIIFRGTDDTLTGWYEDMQLSYKDVNSQFEAVKYLNKHCHFYKKYYCLGHSKGGNLSLYASVNCKHRIQNCIKQIISFDGPGLRNDSYALQDFNSVKDKFIKYVPEFDVVGLIYNNNENRVIVKSSNKGIMQHSAYSWQVEGKNFVTTNSFDENTILINKIIDSFLLKTTIMERQEFVEDLFNGLNKLNIRSIYDFNFHDISSILKLIKTFDDFNDNSKKAVSILLSDTTEVFGSRFTNDISNALSSWVDKHKFW